MKIKTVCELTELTDRTIRYYIDEQLIFVVRLVIISKVSFLREGFSLGLMVSF